MKTTTLKAPISTIHISEGSSCACCHKAPVATTVVTGSYDREPITASVCASCARAFPARA